MYKIAIGEMGGMGFVGVSGGVCRCVRQRTCVRAVSEQSVARWSIGASAASLGATLANRLITGGGVDAQSRADLLCVASGAMLLLYGIANLNVGMREEEAVELFGETVFECDDGDDPDGFLRWTADAIPTSISNVRSVLLYQDDRTVLRSGVMGPASSISKGPILADALATQKRLYWAKLSILPGRFEFDYLPPNTQAVVVQPLSPTSALILGADKVRPLTPVDFGWIQAIADRIAERRAS